MLGVDLEPRPERLRCERPDKDIGVITPSAALSSIPYAPEEPLRALRYFLTRLKNRIWGRFGFVDAFARTATGVHGPTWRLTKGRSSS